MTPTSMNADDFIAYLGKTDDHPDLQQLLRRLGARQAPKMKRGERHAEVLLDALGLDLVFMPLEEKRSSQLLLQSVRLHGAAQGSRRPFAGTLPFELQFSDSRSAARKKVGPPTACSDERNADAWAYMSHSLLADYARGRGSIARLHLTLPPDEDEDE